MRNANNNFSPFAGIKDKDTERMPAGIVMPEQGIL